MALVEISNFPGTPKLRCRVPNGTLFYDWLAANDANFHRDLLIVRNGVKSTAYWHPRTGAKILRNSSAIGAKFIRDGRERGMGYPSLQERAITGGAYQSFTTPTGRTTKVLWSRSTGAYGIKEYGAIGRLWTSRGHERGFGWPVTDEYRVGTEVHQRFSKGYTLRWSSVTGHTWVTR